MVRKLGMAVASRGKKLWSRTSEIVSKGKNFGTDIVKKGRGSFGQLSKVKKGALIAGTAGAAGGLAYGGRKLMKRRRKAG